MRVSKLIIVVTFVLLVPAVVMAEPLYSVLGEKAINRIIEDETKKIAGEMGKQGYGIYIEKEFLNSIVGMVGRVKVNLSGKAAENLLRSRYNQFLRGLVQSMPLDSDPWGVPCGPLYKGMRRCGQFSRQTIIIYMRTADCGSFPCPQTCDEGKPCDEYCNDCPRK